MTTLNFRAAALLLAAAAATAALAATSGLNAAKSTVIATFKQENVPVDAPFKSFSGTIKYDAAKPDSSSAQLTVDMTSLDIGDEAYNAEVRKPAWFDSAHFPQGTFISASIKPGAAGHFDATGTLTIKGKSVTLVVPVAYAKAGTVETYDGSFDISRKALGIGDPAWADVLDDKVHVRFHLVSGS